MKKKKSNVKENLSRCALVLLYIVLGGLTIMLFLSIPDLIWRFREVLYKIPGWNIILVDIDKAKYISMMLTIISCGISGILSYIAYRLSQKVGQLSMDSNSTKLAFAAYKVKKYIYDSSQIIKKRMQGITELTDLKVEEDLIEQWMELCMAGEFEGDETKFLYTYNKKLARIARCYKEQKTEDLEKALDSFGQEYFYTDEEEIKFNEKTEYIKIKLNKLSVGGDR